MFQREHGHPTVGWFLGYFILKLKEKIGCTLQLSLFKRLMHISMFLNA